MIPIATLRWNAGVHNYMTYITGDIPVGAYNSTRLANIGIGHGAIDAGGGYTYFNPQTGHEFSAVLGFTYNFENQSTQYQNGVDMHLDWGASQFLTKQLQIGLVGYVYKQIGCDSGSGDRVGCFQSQVVGVGPQIGYIFPVGDMQGYLNLKGYKEFAAENRPEGWNTWVTFVISPAAPRPAHRPGAWSRNNLNSLFDDRFGANPDFLLGGRTSSAECRHWPGKAVRWSSCAILLSAPVMSCSPAVMTAPPSRSRSKRNHEGYRDHHDGVCHLQSVGTR